KNFANISPQDSRILSKSIHRVPSPDSASIDPRAAPDSVSAATRCRDEDYERSHHSVHASPAAPVTTKTQRQLAQLTINAISGGATIPPTAVPALMMPMAVARCPTAKPPATARLAAGNPPPSPIPSKKRLPASIAK